jgi:biotin-dependent carboxylase-like uncharacterized protein
LVEDLGRPGLAHLGVTRSGVADRRAHLLANRLLGNDGHCATVEVTLGGLRVRVLGGGVDIAITGAPAAPTLNGIPFGLNSIQHVRDGGIICLAAPRQGLRTYLGVRGGIAVDPILGSRSFDTMSGIGPPPLRPGDLVPIGAPTGAFPGLDQAPVAAVPGGPVELRVIPGPRTDWFDEPDALVRTEWRVSEQSDRVGVRLQGTPLIARWTDRQLPSEGAVRGAIQVPPSGLPVILGPDHPVTGGYPVVGVVADADTDALAQVRGGQLVRLRWHRRGYTAGSAHSW